MAAQYDGPGVYEVELEYLVRYTIRVNARCRDEAGDLARDEACGADPDDQELEHVSITCINQSADPQSGEVFERLTSLEEACWMLTGEVPREALKRIEAELAVERMKGAV